LRPFVKSKVEKDAPLEKVRGILDAEEQVKLAELRQERKENARDHMASAIENFKKLNLTDEQTSQIAAIRQEYRPKDPRGQQQAACRRPG